MKIETKIDVGEEIFFMMHNEVVQSKITYITVNISKDGVDTEYSCEKAVNLKEYKVFLTKQELLNSL